MEIDRLADGVPFDDVKGRGGAHTGVPSTRRLAAGGDQVWTQDRIAAGLSVAGDITIGSEAGDHFGWALVAAGFDDDGFVAFQATLADGRSGVYHGTGGPITSVIDPATDPLSHVISHPDIDAARSVCCDATLASGGPGVILVRCLLAGSLKG